MDNVASHLQCLCGVVWEEASLLESTRLPLETELCHCNPCRQSSGALACAFVKLARSPSQRALDACTPFTKQRGRAVRYHCSACGSRTFDYATGIDAWFACSGIIEPTRKGPGRNVVRITKHEYVLDTGDGGFAPLMQRLGDRAIPLYGEGIGPNESEISVNELNISRPDRGSETKRREDRLFGSCLCGSIKFHVQAPNPDQFRNLEIAKWLRAAGQKYLGLNCACRFCRLAFGHSIGSNAYVMPENILSLPVDGNEKPLFDYNSHDEHTSDFSISTKALQSTFPAMKFDLSSEGNRRSFCGTCGANAFFERRDRPECVNIAFGLLRAESGVLAEDWVEFDWAGLSSEDDGVDSELSKALMAAGAR